MPPSPAVDSDPVSLRCQLGYPDLETFITGYAGNLSAGGLFIPSSAPPPVGTRVRFELLLVTAQAALRGEGEVTWATVGTGPDALSGAGIRLIALDGPSRRVLSRAIAHKSAHPEAFFSSAPDPFATTAYQPPPPPPPPPAVVGTPAQAASAPLPVVSAPIVNGHERSLRARPAGTPAPEEAELMALLKPRRAAALPGPLDPREAALKLDALLGLRRQSAS